LVACANWRAEAQDRVKIGAVKIYFDESIHTDHAFMLIAYVLCREDPEPELTEILSEFGVTEFHACVKMRGNRAMQRLRDKFSEFVNVNASWGVVVLPSSSRYCITAEIRSVVQAVITVYNCPLEIFFDEGVLSRSEIQTLSSISGVVSLLVCPSHSVKGIQLADLVAALNGVRLREELSGEPKMLVYGKESGYDPPIDAELGSELWAKLRNSMMRSPAPLGDDMPEMAIFATRGYGLFISPECSFDLARKAEKVFGAVYLGCFH